jgi:osmotically inducible protein OsmC
MNPEFPRKSISKRKPYNEKCKSALHRQSPHHGWQGRRVPQLRWPLGHQAFVPRQAGSGTNPEQLFAAGWSACFMGAMGLAAAKMKTRLPADAAIDDEVDLCDTGGEYFLQARPQRQPAGGEREVAQALVDAAHQTCPYSKATRGNIYVAINVV